MTLRELIAAHSEWLDHTLVVHNPNSWKAYDYIGGSGSVYEDDEMEDVPGRDCQPTGNKLLVFSPN